MVDTAETHAHPPPPPRVPFEARDFMVLAGGVLFLAVVFVVINLLIDILYAYLDPRITY